VKIPMPRSGFLGFLVAVSAPLLLYLGGPGGSTLVSFGGLPLVVLAVVSSPAALLDAPAAYSRPDPIKTRYGETSRRRTRFQSCPLRLWCTTPTRHTKRARYTDHNRLERSAIWIMFQSINIR